MPLPAIIGGIGAVAGGVAGAIPKTSNSSSTTSRNLAPASELENQGLGGLQAAFNQLQGLVGGGPGQSDVDAAYGSQKDLAALLKQLTQSGGLPGQQDITQAQGFASSVFAPQQTAIHQNYQTSLINAQREAARLGRPVSDPVIQAKLQRELMNQQNMLESQKTAYGSQLAMSLPGQRLNYATQGSNVLSGLAEQAFKNRAAILSAGSDIANMERNFRLNAAPTTTSGSQTSGGGLGGAIGGALGGLAGGVSAGGSFANLFGGNQIQAPSFGGYGGGSGGGYGLGVNTSMPSGFASPGSSPNVFNLGQPSISSQIGSYKLPWQ